MKYRYLIERASAASGWSFTLSEITPDDETGSVLGNADHVEVLQLQASGIEAERSDETLKWKEPPKSWQPDAIYISQTLDDGMVTSRDA